MRRIVTLCTDFGPSDGYVGAMKGVLLSIDPQVTLMDISHGVERHSVWAGAFVLDTAYRFFPPGTVHLVVVDPGVGSERRAIAVRTERYTFVAPDNGVLTHALRRDPAVEAVSLTARAYWRDGDSSSTFHGRDIFAPAAAHIARGVALSALGPPVDNLVTLPLPAVDRLPGGVIRGHVIHTDHFGNVITDIPAAMVVDRSRPTITVGETEIPGLSATYASVATGELLALIGSHGNIEIAVREGSAAARTGARPGDPVLVK